MKQKLINFFNKGFSLLTRIATWFTEHKKTTRAISVAFSVIFIVYLIYYLKDDFQVLMNSLEDIRVIYLVFSHLIYGINFYLFFQVWTILLNAFNFNVEKNVSQRIFSSTYFSKFIPTPVMFYISRITQLDRIGIDAKNSTAITVLEFVFQFFSGLSVLSFININFQKPLTFLWFFALIPSFILILIPALSNLDFISQAKENQPKFNSKKIALTLIIQLIPWILGGVFFFFIIKAITPSQLPISFIGILNIWIISNLSSMIGSYLLGGLGVLREFTLLLLLQNSYGPSITILLTALVRIMLTLSGVLWAGFGYLIPHLFPPKSKGT